MISKRNSKFINSLHIKKYRNEHRAFSVEGEKNICEILKSDFNIQQLFLTETAFNVVKLLVELKNITVEICSIEELGKVSFFQSNNFGIAVVDQPIQKKLILEKGLQYLALENVKDPGNLGTILRGADWYGVTDIICSVHCVDVYNPKVIASTMGSFIRVHVHYVDLEDFLDQTKLPIYGAVLGGDVVHDLEYVEPGILVMGNESKGMSTNLKNKCDKLLMIPSFGGAESLNVAMATTVLLDNLKRLNL
jgi:TrmH family RNA methyltransferase